MRQVASGLQAQLVLALDDQEDVLALGDLAEQALGGLGRRRLGRGHAGDDVDAVVAGPVGERTAQSGGDHLLRGPLRVVARHGTVHDATAGELRRTGRALTGAAGALLAVRLLAATADLGTSLGLVGALTGRSELRHDDLVHQRNADLRVEDLGRQLEAAGLVARGRQDVNGAHILTAPSPRCGRGRGRRSGPGLRP